MKRRKGEWNHVMSLIHRVENKYGSIRDTPETDPTWKEIAKLCTIGSNPHGLKVSAKKQVAVLQKVKQGYTKTYIRGNCHIGEANIDRIVVAAGVQFIQPFSYVLYKEGEGTYFLRSKLRDIPLIFDQRLQNMPAINKYIKENHWNLRCKRTIWKNIPIGSYYISQDHERFIHKKDDNYLSN